MMQLQLIHDQGIQGALELKDEIKVPGFDQAVSVEDYLTQDRFARHGSVEERLGHLTRLASSLSGKNSKSSFPITQAVTLKARMTILRMNPSILSLTTVVRGNNPLELVEGVHETIRGFCKKTPCWSHAQIYEFNEALGNPLPRLTQLNGKNPKIALLYLPTPEASRLLK